MEPDKDIVGKLLTVLLIAFFICPFWLGSKSEDKDNPKPKSLADKIYKYFLIISLSIIAFIILMGMILKG